MSKLTDELHAIDAEMERRINEAQRLESAASEWLNQSKTPCNQVLKKKREPCEADKAMKAEKGNGLIAQAKALKDISDLQKTKVQLERLVESEAIAQETLATQGKDSNYLRIEATGKAAAEMEAARNISTAQADNLRKSAADSTKARNTILIIVGVCIVVAVGVAIFLKIKKKKSKSKK